MVDIALISLYGVENTGIRTISSLLKNNGFNVNLIFFKRWMNNDIALPTEKEKEILLALLKELNVGVVGFSFTSPFLKIAQELTMRIKASLPIKVIWGGIHATVMSQECLRFCDIVCRGEGEFTMLELVKALSEEKPLEGIRNICYKRQNEVIFEEVRPLIQNLDILPFQDYGGENKFFIERGLRSIDPLINARELRVFASRGCPFNCSYCYNSIFRKLYENQNYHRIKGVENVISEIKEALSKFRNIKKIKFDDDTFIFPQRWIDKFYKKYRQDINLPFEILFNPGCLNQSNLRKLKIAGLNRVQLGIQTGSKRESEEVYDRKLPLKKIKQFAQTAKRLKIDVVYDVILDNPLADFKDKKELINFLLTLPKPFSLFLYSLTIFPGTKLSELLLDKKIIKPENIEGNCNKSFYQFRLSFSYPRPKEELFIACIISLTSKSFLPRSLVRLLRKSLFLKKHPFLLRWFAEWCNLMKLFYVSLKLLTQGTLNMWKFREYGLPRRFLIQ